MSRQFTSGEAKRLIRHHLEISDNLKVPSNYVASLRAEITTDTHDLAKEEVLRVLKDVSVDEINRNKMRIRISALKSAGYNNIADLAVAPVQRLAFIEGISYSTAILISNEVKDIIAQTSKNVKIKLSEDNKSSASSKLVLTLSKYRDALNYETQAKELMAKNSDEVRHLLELLKPGTGALKWLFTPKRDRENAENAYTELSKKLKSDYATKAKELTVLTEDLSARSEDTAWANFSKHSVEFISILEDIAPGLLGNGDSVYGLPEDLARAIQTEAVLSDGLLCTLRRYQEWGVKYILHQKKVLLGDEMGLGKTVQAIATMVSLQTTGATHFVVVCPASVLSNWCREVAKHSTLNVVKVHGGEKEAALKEWNLSGGVAVTTYETAKIWLEPQQKINLLVVDEAHYIKNPKAGRTRDVKQMCERADRLLFMTGTALENNVDEMVSLINILRPDIASEVKHMKFLASAPQFKEKIAPVYYRRKREDVLTELPELEEVEAWCDLSPKEEKIYEQAVLEKRFADARRVSWNVSDMKDSSKARRLIELIEEAASDGRKIIVFSFFLDTIDYIKEALGDKCYGPINGSVPPLKRQEIIDKFEQAPAGSVLVAQIQSGGTGLNIQAASVVVICEPQFKPSTENQAISRAYRMGQTRKVLVYRLLANDTVDERITDILKNKQKIFDAFADESVAAKDMQIDDASFKNIIQEEIDRINAKAAK